MLLLCATSLFYQQPPESPEGIPDAAAAPTVQEPVDPVLADAVPVSKEWISLFQAFQQATGIEILDNSSTSTMTETQFNIVAAKFFKFLPARLNHRLVEAFDAGNGSFVDLDGNEKELRPSPKVLQGTEGRKNHCVAKQEQEAVACGGPSRSRACDCPVDGLFGRKARRGQFGVQSPMP